MSKLKKAFNHMVMTNNGSSILEEMKKFTEDNGLVYVPYNETINVYEQGVSEWCSKHCKDDFVDVFGFGLFSPRDAMIVKLKWG